MKEGQQERDIKRQRKRGKRKRIILRIYEKKRGKNRVYEMEYILFWPLSHKKFISNK